MDITIRCGSFDLARLNEVMERKMFVLREYNIDWMNENKLISVTYERGTTKIEVYATENVDEVIHKMERYGV